MCHQLFGGSPALFADKIYQVDCEEYSDNYVDHYPGSGSGSGSGDWYEDGRNQVEGTTNNSLHDVLGSTYLRRDKPIDVKLDYEGQYNILKTMMNNHPALKDRIISEEIASEQFRYYLQALILELQKINFNKYNN